MICRKNFRPDTRHRRDQKYCRRCAKKAKRERDRVHKRRYRDTGLGKAQRTRENRTYREHIGWTEYMRYWRKAQAKRARAERERARRYYRKHREKILRKLREKRTTKKQSRKACSH